MTERQNDRIAEEQNTERTKREKDRTTREQNQEEQNDIRRE